jgi:O-antigen ligase
LPLTVSRSAILAVAVAVLVYAVDWSPRGRFNGLVIGAFGLVAFRAAVPGLLGTLRSFFLQANDDPSIQGRTEDYAHIPGLLEHHWLFGRGLGTFRPAQYFFLDNQYLGTLLEGGVVALVALIAVYVVGMGMARGARKHSIAPATRSLGQALAAGIAALAVSAFTFDEFGFKQSAFLLFLLVGCAGALWRMTRAPVEPRLRRQPTADSLMIHGARR